MLSLLVLVLSGVGVALSFYAEFRLSSSVWATCCLVNGARFFLTRVVERDVKCRAQHK